MTTYGTYIRTIDTGTSTAYENYTMYGRVGSTIIDEFNRLANGGEYPTYDKYLDLQGAIGYEQLNKFEEIEANRKRSKETIEHIFTSQIEGVRGVNNHDSADVSWFGTPFICDEPGLKHRLVQYL